MLIRKLIPTFLGSAVLLAAPPIQVGFVYNSPVGDCGWSYQHDQGRKEMEASLKGLVTTQVIENIPESADAERVLRTLAQSGCKVVFSTSFGYMNQTIKVAAQFPDVAFLHSTGYKGAKNVGLYNARFYEGRYLCGVIAGRMTKSNLAGYVAAFPIPEVIQGINAFAQGMRSVNPKAELRVIWVNSWYDPGKEREAASVLISQGCDMISHHASDPAVNQLVEEKHKELGVWSFGYPSDMGKYGPTSQLTATVHVWGPFYTETVKKVMAGQWTSANVWGGFKEGMVKLAPLNPAIPKDVRDQVAKLQEGLRTGKVHPFQGPVIAQDGTVKVPAGKTMTDDELGSMSYYVQGVAGVLPVKSN